MKKDESRFFYLLIRNINSVAIRYMEWYRLVCCVFLAIL